MHSSTVLYGSIHPDFLEAEPHRAEGIRFGVKFGRRETSAY